jgi:hypothetical protein
MRTRRHTFAPALNGLEARALMVGPPGLLVTPPVAYNGIGREIDIDQYNPYKTGVGPGID